MTPTPEAAFGRLPLEGATPADWQSQIRGVCLSAAALNGRHGC